MRVKIKQTIFRITALCVAFTLNMFCIESKSIDAIVSQQPASKISYLSLTINAVRIKDLLYSSVTVGTNRKFYHYGEVEFKESNADIEKIKTALGKNYTNISLEKRDYMNVFGYSIT